MPLIGGFGLKLLVYDTGSSLDLTMCDCMTFHFIWYVIYCIADLVPIGHLPSATSRPFSGKVDKGVALVSGL